MIQLLKPFADPKLNDIKETSIWQIFFVFLIALLIKNNDSDSVFLAVCLMVTFFMNFIILGVKFVANWWLRYRSHTTLGDQDGQEVGGVAEKEEVEVEMNGRLSRSTEFCNSNNKSCTVDPNNDSAGDSMTRSTTCGGSLTRSPFHTGGASI